MTRIAIVGMACRYPDAASPVELWENAVAGRRAFRRIPDDRLRLEDYWDPDPAAPDRFYARHAAVIEGYEFDRIAYKVAGSTYRSTDLTHWLALDTAALALADAGFPMGEGLPRERTGVVVGNTLTGEFSRANQLRLRWPYVRRMVAASLKDQDWDDKRLATFLEDFESTFKSPFPAVDEDTLAGGLSNTIAGRICNHFDLNGGGYTVDGACSSSLLSVATASNALLEHDIDVAIAGGVDLSIDPFEIIGFAKAGALATGEMRVYDRNSNGFWPGEGCGMVVLMREEDARRAGHRIYASVAGWGISSDGRGGITRPEVSGYRLALRRAYERAGFGIETVGLFEGHGTGTKVGDATELRALSEARAQAGPGAAPAAIGSIKAMIGHTKAAAGVAGLIKTAMAVHHRMLPPTLGCVDPHELLTQDHAPLRALRQAESWPERAEVRAGITAMGFGGINTHIVLDGTGSRRRMRTDTRLGSLAASVQDSELLLVDAASVDDLRERVNGLIDFIGQIAYAELTDLAATLHADLRDLPFRAAVVVSSPEDALHRLERVRDALDAGQTRLFADHGRAVFGHVNGPGRIGFLFPGQGSGRGVSGGILGRRFVEAAETYTGAALPVAADAVATEVAQPRIVTGSMAGLRVLERLGIDATVAVGHSLGELSALHWAQAMNEQDLLRIAALRGRTMAQHSASGTMAGVAGPAAAVAAVIAGIPVVIAGYNGSAQTVVAGTEEGIEQARTALRDAGLETTRLAVSHAFHSPLVAPAADAFVAALDGTEFLPVERRVVSTVTGQVLPADADLLQLLRTQITEPVLFSQALAQAATEVDLFVEVGPGRVLAGLASSTTDVPAVALDTDSESMTGLLSVVGAAYVTGAAKVHPDLFRDRLTRALSLGTKFSFFESPCEAAPPLALAASATTVPAVAEPVPVDQTASTVDMLRRIVAERAELPLEMVHAGSRLLDDLHMSSITVGQVLNQVAQAVGVPAAQLPTNLATASLGELADMLDTLAATADPDAATSPGTSAEVAGAGAWARAWAIDLREEPLPAREVSPASGVRGHWQFFASAEHPYAEALHLALEHGRVGEGTLVCLPEQSTEADVLLALRGAQAAAAAGRGHRFVLVQSGAGAAGLAKTLHQEAPQVPTTIVHVPPSVPGAIEWIVREVAATTSYAEVYYDADGVRRVPTLRVLPVTPERTTQALRQDEVLLVTGGGKGITAECALALALDTGARLALVGRADPAQDAELAANLQRMREAGATVWYGRADVTDAGQVRAVVAEAERALGPVAGVLHGAGRNEPAALSNVDEQRIRETFAPKIDGLAAVLDAVDVGQLRLLVTFGSIIGRAGLRGEAHYATANEWLVARTAAFAERRPDCKVLCLEWSVWSGVGMGERLSVVESLTRDGIVPLTPDQGIELLRRLLRDPDAPTVVVASGRTGAINTVRYDLPPLPMLRFIEQPLVRYHGVELVSEVTLNAGTDPYLVDHLLDGNLLMPAVLGMEAMAQVAGAVSGHDGVPVIHDAEFLRPIVIPPDGETVVRIAALVVADDTVEVVIRSAETGFAAEHFRARLQYGGPDVASGAPDQVDDALSPVPLEPFGDLYGDILFQGGRFQRLRGYHRAAARHVDADVASVASVAWFAPFLPAGLILGDPGVRDTLMHGNQVCVPDATLLPAGVDRIHPAGDRIVPGTVLRYCATERSRDGDTYVYDIALRDEDGTVVERWEGLRLRAVRKSSGRGPWSAPLLGPYLERALGDLVGAAVAVVVEPDGPDVPGPGTLPVPVPVPVSLPVPGVAGPGADGRSEHVRRRRERTATAAGRALGRIATVRYRPDGRPELDGGPTLSASHDVGVTLCVVGEGPLGCDVKQVDERTAQQWQDLLGVHANVARLTAAATGESDDTAATRVWGAIECLQKAGRSTRDPLILRPETRPGWALFSSGTLRVATFVTQLRGVDSPVMFAVLSEGQA
ncbi:type I polyketide synthase [Dactylosporangium sp. NPDC051485]|uniref:type I polyketide synthase n=1 Tax=Dactylosporangium sp. NPDC051485 TaxID=3154846 RepID=UPI00342EB7FD